MQLLTHIASYLHIDKRMVTMKMHYFAFTAGVSSCLLFGPTIMKQLGYSAITVGTVYTVLPLATMTFKFFFCFAADKFKKRKLLLHSTIVVNLFSNLLLIFVPELNRSPATVRLQCLSNKLLISYCNKDVTFPPNLQNFKLPGKMITCRLKCVGTYESSYQLCNTWKMEKYCDTRFADERIQKIANKNFKNFAFNAVLSLLYLTKNEICLNAVISAINFNERENISISNPHCDAAGLNNSTDIDTICKTKCDYASLMDALNPTDYPVFHSEFWFMLFVYLVFFSSMAVNSCITDTLCYELLGDNPDLFGFTRLFASLGWGIFSILGGWIADKFGADDNVIRKNYTFTLLLAVGIMFVDLIVSFFIKVVQEHESKIILVKIIDLFKNVRIVMFSFCCFYVGMVTALIWEFLYWHLEDISTPEELKWSKTIQGVIGMINAFLSEIPFLILSGWIIKMLGHIQTISLVLFFLSIRMMLYAMIRRPLLVLPVEMLSGLTFGIFYANMTSYGYVIAPPGMHVTMQSIFSSAFDGFGVAFGSLFGGFVYQKYKGPTMYFSAAVSTFIVFIIQCLIGLIFPDVTHTPKLNGELNSNGFG